LAHCHVKLRRCQDGGKLAVPISLHHKTLAPLSLKASINQVIASPDFREDLSSFSSKDERIAN
jgi:hypothetical protein